MSCGCARPCGRGRSRLGFSLVDQTKIVTAASELARNTVDYGGGGSVRIEIAARRRAARLRLTFTTRARASPTSSWP